MTKKIMMVAVLLGALTLGACVDNNESASVEAVRNAKAAQLNSIAALNNANAEAAKITAEAEVALKNAETEFKKNETEEAKQKFAVRIEVIKAKAAEAIAKAKKNAAEAEQDLLDVADAHIRMLYTNYRNALGEITPLNNRKIELVANIASAEAGLIPIKNQTVLEVTRYQGLIDNEQFKIDTYAKYEGVDKTELEQKATILYKDYQKANDVQTQKQSVKTEVEGAYNLKASGFNMWDDVVEPIKTVVAAKKLQNAYYGTITETQTVLSNSKTISYYTLNASNLERAKQELASRVKSHEDRLGKTTDDDTKSSLYGQLALVKKQKAAALEADPDADVTYFDNRIAQLNADITTTKVDLDAAKSTLTNFDGLVASFAGDDLKAYDAAVADLKKLAETYEIANTDYLKAQTAVQKALTEYQVAYQLSQQNDVDQLIAECKTNIAEYESTKLVWKNQVTTQETAIAQYKEELKTVGVKIDAQNAIIANWEAQIKAAIEAQK